MRWTQFFIPTSRETPADAIVASHKLMIRAGLVRQLAAGIYSSVAEVPAPVVADVEAHQVNLGDARGV